MQKVTEHLGDVVVFALSTKVIIGGKDKQSKI